MRDRNTHITYVFRGHAIRETSGNSCIGEGPCLGAGGGGCRLPLRSSGAEASVTLDCVLCPLFIYLFILWYHMT